MINGRGELAALNERVAQLRTEVADLEKTVKTLETELDGLQSLINRIKGGVATIMIIGAVIGWLTTTFGHLLFHATGT